MGRWTKATPGPRVVPARAARTAEEVLAQTGMADFGVVYSSRQVEEIFNRKPPWLRVSYYNGAFDYPLGSDQRTIHPYRDGKNDYWYAEDVQRIAVLRFQRGLIDADELKKIVRRLIRDTSVYDRNYLVKHAHDD